MIDLDANATTRPTPGVIEAVTRGLEQAWHNPSSLHRAGQSARASVELARADLARLIGAPPRQLTLTSSGTESIHLAIRGAIALTGRRAIVISELEHAAGRDLALALEREGVEVRRLSADAHGRVDVSRFDELIDDRVAVVSVQWVNNETGVIQPVEAIASACRERGVLFHTDAVQRVGKLPVDLSAADAPAIDLLSFSAHKFHGPKGVGALSTRRGITLAPTTPGAQELGRRGGTENVPGILGAGAAAREAIAFLEEQGAINKLLALRDRLETTLLEQLPGASVNGDPSLGARVWNTTNLTIPGVESERLLLALSEQGLSASAGSACSSGSIEPSPVLLAMGLSEKDAERSIRLSLSRNTTNDEIDRAIEVLVSCARRIGAGGA